MTFEDAADAEFDFDRQRARMVETQLARRDIRDPAVLEAMAAVPRHRFLPPAAWDEAYDDHPVRIGCDQTISQPYIVAVMTQLLEVRPGARVLEIGTGSGYQTAVLAEVGAEVYTVERHVELARRAEALLDRLGYAERIRFRVGDGTRGWPEEAPFDRILVTAAAPEVPPSLEAQLADGGRMVIPCGRHRQHLRRIDRHGDAYDGEDVMGVLFVPLVGEEGVPEA